MRCRPSASIRSRLLVVPRVLALLIALPLLTVLADVIGLVGGALLCHVLLDMPLMQYLNRAQGAIATTTFWVGHHQGARVRRADRPAPAAPAACGCAAPRASSAG